MNLCRTRSSFISKTLGSLRVLTFISYQACNVTFPLRLVTEEFQFFDQLMASHRSESPPRVFFNSSSDKIFMFQGMRGTRMLYTGWIKTEGVGKKS